MKCKLDQILRVDHAGEIGASKIYEGQIKILGNTEIGPLLQKMKDQEQEHLDTFHQLLNDHKVRPTALLPIWNAAGFVLGAFTASLGKDAAMACTIAVEEVIGKHYQKQAASLTEKKYSKLRKKLLKFRDDELEHKDIATENDGMRAPGYKLMKLVIQTGCKAAIKISEKI
tara:strand:- start:78 stop:590 length:513 start_codon:yes stop_codon:yes gene_type:complete